MKTKVSLNYVFQMLSKVLDKPRQIVVYCNSVDDKQKIMELVKEEKLVRHGSIFQ